MTFRKPFVTAVGLLMVSAGVQASPAVDALLAEYRQQGMTQFDAEAGRQLWNREFSTPSGPARSCASCHTDNPRQPGKHAKTGKPIKPMAPSMNPQRLSNVKDMRKWFSRNCKWTLGRACTAQEQGDVLLYLQGL